MDRPTIRDIQRTRRSRRSCAHDDRRNPTSSPARADAFLAVRRRHRQAVRRAHRRRPHHRRHRRGHPGARSLPAAARDVLRKRARGSSLASGDAGAGGRRRSDGTGRLRATRDLVRRSAWLAVAGLVGGGVLSLGAMRLVAAYLVGVSPRDPVTFLAVAGTIVCAAALAADDYSSVPGSMPSRTIRSSPTTRLKSPSNVSTHAP